MLDGEKAGTSDRVDGTEPCLHFGEVGRPCDFLKGPSAAPVKQYPAGTPRSWIAPSGWGPHPFQARVVGVFPLPWALSFLFIPTASILFSPRGLPPAPSWSTSVEKRAEIGMKFVSLVLLICLL